MPSTTIFKRGDIVLVPFPFTDLSPPKEEKDIDTDLQNNAIISDDTLLRFAKPHRYNGIEEAPHILFDLTAESIDATNLPAGTIPDPDRLWGVHNGKFQGEIDEKPFDAQLTFNPDTDRFEIDSPDLDHVRLPDEREGIHLRLSHRK
jgi:hypothetical protein